MKTRLRTLYADGRRYAWRAEIGHVSGTAVCHRCVRLVVWGAGKNSRRLRADLLSTAWGLPWGCATDDSYPTPADVRAVIDFARVSGWEPEAVGGEFVLTEARAGGWRRPDFLVTDRLRDPSAADPSARVREAQPT